ncbi:MAG: selenium-dependent molybdenum cofactor biosynthesis protein YqeB [Chloroflexi bacterium]|nr:selenium-dependent molybdenum cofactor biosynthesis protein YqeB [Chloroflexota bacterium]MCL5074113.1 selenium-dependent molybdenum cofactor biosynthesis protein YqeB [Chloroflexota bacterium]
MLKDILVVIRGGGDLGSGVAHRLYRSGFRVMITEHPQPTVIRRPVSFASAVFEGEVEVEGVQARLAKSPFEITSLLSDGLLAVIVDPQAETVQHLRPQVLVDAIMAKRNLGTKITDAPIVVALGPGFVAGQDVHAVIETARGHYLGKVILLGTAAPNTGVPGEVAGYSVERVIRSPATGTFHGIKKIGDQVVANEMVAFVDTQPVHAGIGGVLRGLLADGLWVRVRDKVGDVDPRARYDYCFTISDKARAIGGGALEAILYFLSQSGEH